MPIVNDGDDDTNNGVLLWCLVVMQNVEANFNVDLSKIDLTEVPIDLEVDRVAIEHLYVTGKFELGDSMGAESHITDVEEIKTPYIELCMIERDLKNRNVSTVQTWVEEHSGLLERNNTKFEHLSFLIARIQFLQLMDKEGKLKAVQFARENMARYFHSHSAQLRQLLGSVACSNIVHNRSTYAKYHEAVIHRYTYLQCKDDDTLWEEIGREFRRQFCYVLGYPQDPPLLVSVAAGSAVLPTLLKYAEVASKAKSTALLSDSKDDLPIELPLPDEFVFHSTFACPVSKARNTSVDPAMLLPCGHCLNKASIFGIMKVPSGKLKCPYCPAWCQLDQCKPLTFPVL